MTISVFLQMNTNILMMIAGFRQNICPKCQKIHQKIKALKSQFLAGNLSDRIIAEKGYWTCKGDFLVVQTFTLTGVLLTHNLSRLIPSSLPILKVIPSCRFKSIRTIVSALSCALCRDSSILSQNYCL